MQKNTTGAAVIETPLREVGCCIRGDAHHESNASGNKTSRAPSFAATRRYGTGVRNSGGDRGAHHRRGRVHEPEQCVDDGLQHRVVGGDVGGLALARGAHCSALLCIARIEAEHRVLILLTLLCVPIVVTDLIARRIPNVWLLCVGALTLAWMAWRAWHGEPRVWWVHGLGALIGLIVLLPFWWRGVMGAGDVKLFAVIGLVAGYPALLPVWCLASVAAGLHALVLLAGRVRGLARWRDRFAASRAWQSILRWRDGRIGLPYGAYLAAAALVVR